jgi:fumarylacetoacetate (FAA) hydrolase family protein
MAAHVRAQLRRQVKTLLGGLVALGGNVFVGRTWPIGADALPCALVYTLEEPSSDITLAPARQQRLLTLKVEARAASGTSDEALLEQLDAMALAIEVAVLAPGALTAAKAVELTETTTAAGASSDSRYGQLELTFRVEYHTAAGAPDTAI